jgi:hypothetical protein
MVGQLQALATAHDGFAVVTLVFAVLGVVLAVVSLVWQAVTFLLGGARVKTRLLLGGLGPGGAILWELGDESAELSPEDLPVVAVEVTNSGRTDLDVVGWGLDYGRGLTFIPSPWSPNKELPFRLKHGSQQIWFVKREDADHAANAVGRAHAVSGFVRLGTGHTERTKEQLDVAPVTSRRR